MLLRRAAMKLSVGLRSLRQWWTRQYLVNRHSLESALGAGSLKWRLVQFLVEAFVLAAGFIAVKPLGGGLILVTLVLVKLFFRIWKGTAPVSLKEVELSSRKRSFAIFELVLGMSRFPSMTLHEVRSFQRNVLMQIASYARDMRGDAFGRKIFANLLEDRGDALEVTARSDSRPTGARVSKNCCVAWTCLQTQDKAFTGDLYAQFPAAPSGKKYASILAIPVIDAQSVVLGVVTIDSKERHHFDEIHEDVIMHVMPLVAMLGWTIARTAWFSENKKEVP